MSIADWFSARESKRYTRITDTQVPAPVGADVADGVWIKCENCKKIIYEGELVETLRVAMFALGVRTPRELRSAGVIHREARA